MGFKECKINAAQLQSTIPNWTTCQPQSFRQRHLETQSLLTRVVS